jgi:hypothetical protein
MPDRSARIANGVLGEAELVMSGFNQIPPKTMAYNKNRKIANAPFHLLYWERTANSSAVSGEVFRFVTDSPQSLKRAPFVTEVKCRWVAACKADSNRSQSPRSSISQL